MSNIKKTILLENMATDLFTEIAMNLKGKYCTFQLMKDDHFFS